MGDLKMYYKTITTNAVIFVLLGGANKFGGS